MQVKTKVKAGLGGANHNQTLVCDRNRATADTRPRTQRQPLKVKTQLKAGVITTNHNQTLVRDRNRATADTRPPGAAPTPESEDAAQGGHAHVKPQPDAGACHGKAEVDPVRHSATPGRPPPQAARRRVQTQRQAGGWGSALASGRYAQPRAAILAARGCVGRGCKRCTAACAPPCANGCCGPLEQRSGMPAALLLVPSPLLLPVDRSTEVRVLDPYFSL